MRELCAIALVSFLASHAAAQAPDPEARALFEQGLSAVDDGDLGRGESLFRRSLAVRRSGAAVFNLARVLERTGRLSEARSLFDEVASMPGVPAEIGAEAQAHSSALEPRLSYLHVVPPPDGSTEARVDGEPIAVSVEASIDPGRHHVLVQHEGRTVVELTLLLAEGEHREIDARVPSPTEVRPADEPPPPLDDDAPPDAGDDDTWVWVVLGVAGALLVGAVVALAVGFASQPTCEGNVMPGCITAGLVSR